MAVMTSIEDLRRLARKRVPRAIFDYADGGAYQERTLRRNRHDLDALQFRQRVMVDASHQGIATSLVCQEASMPIAIGPTGLAGLFHGNGEIHGARAAQAFGIPFCLSTMSICSIEDVREAVTEPFWFQLYLMRDRGFNQELINRAIAARCPVLMLTLDMPVQGVRRRDIRNGLSIPPRLTLRNALEIALRPRWAAGVLMGKRRTFGNLANRLAASGGLSTLSQWIATQFDASATWADVEWVRAAWPGKLILKGIMNADDAKAAAAVGADAIVVSNHGGRQLDGAPSTIAVLRDVRDALEGRCEVMFDGGIMSGQDLLKAMAFGARGCLIGKAYLYALAAGGESGVTRALEILRDELCVSMALTGAQSVLDIDPAIVLPRV